MEELCKKAQLRIHSETSKSQVPKKERSYLVHHTIPYHHDFSKWKKVSQTLVSHAKDTRYVETHHEHRHGNVKKEQNKHLFELPTIRELVLSPHIYPGSWGMGGVHEKVLSVNTSQKSFKRESKK
jgi:hypothetical protein